MLLLRPSRCGPCVAGGVPVVGNAGGVYRHIGPRHWAPPTAALPGDAFPDVSRKPSKDCIISDLLSALADGPTRRLCAGAARSGSPHDTHQACSESTHAKPPCPQDAAEIVAEPAAAHRIRHGLHCPAERAPRVIVSRVARPKNSPTFSSERHTTFFLHARRTKRSLGSWSEFWVDTRASWRSVRV